MNNGEIAVDYGWNEKKFEVCELGTTKRKKMSPKEFVRMVEPGMSIFTENYPSALARPIIRKVKVLYRFPITFVTEMRKKLDWPKDEAEEDSVFLAKLAEDYREKSRPWYGMPLIGYLFSTLKSIDTEIHRFQNKQWDLGYGLDKAESVKPINDMIETHIKLLNEEEETRKKGGVFKELVDNSVYLLIEEELKKYPVYNEVLDRVNGLGIRLSSFLVNVIEKAGGPGNFETVQGFWHYLGLHVENGAAPRYKAGEQADFDRMNTAEILGSNKIADQLVMNGGHYRREHYDPYKERKRGPEFEDVIRKIEEKAKKKFNRTKLEKMARLNIERMSRRHVAKAFIGDFLIIWRQLEGFSMKPPVSVKGYIPPPDYMIPDGLKPFSPVREGKRGNEVLYDKSESRIYRYPERYGLSKMRKDIDI